MHARVTRRFDPLTFPCCSPRRVNRNNQTPEFLAEIRREKLRRALALDGHDVH